MKLFVLVFAFMMVFTCPVHADEMSDKLVRLKSMHDLGLITSDEYRESKAKILDSFASSKPSNAKSPAPVPHTVVAPPATIPSSTIPAPQVHNPMLSRDIPVMRGNNFVQEMPVDSLIGVLPFYGNVYGDDVREMLAKFSAKNAANYIRRKRYKFKYGIKPFYHCKRQLANELIRIEPDDPYTDQFLIMASTKLKVRYLFFGKIHNYSFDKAVYRFNVECMVYDSLLGKIVFSKRARQSSRRKLFNAYQTKEEGKIIGKITEQFYFFIDKLAASSAMQLHAMAIGN